ncbi:MAG: permease [Verrucomicrobiae bacterium]|nr:permease [Verrucomicrobiae bacterium]
MNKELKTFGWIAGVFLVAYFLPLANPKISGAILEAFKLLQWYVRNHTLACVVPAMFIAGAIITFLSQASVMRYLGPQAHKPLAYLVASVSGFILAVCSCSVLPVFAGIYALGAGLGPASAFLYSGPAINILAVFLTARVLGLPMGVARAVGAVAFALLIGVLMAVIFRRSETKRSEEALQMPEPDSPARPLWKTVLYFGCMVGFLVFSDWYNPGDVVVRTTSGAQFAAVALQETKDEVVFQLQQDWNGRSSGEKVTLAKPAIASVQEADTWVIAVHHKKWWLAGAMGLVVLVMVWRWFSRDEIKTWMSNTWDFCKMIIPLLFGGVFVVGFVGALLPEKYVASLVGDNSLRSNLVASLVGVFWYFATLTEIPICETLGKLGMHQGPMLTLLLAGPALSLPSMLVIARVVGFNKTAAFTLLVVVMSTATGMMYGSLFK